MLVANPHYTIFFAFFAINQKTWKTVAQQHFCPKFFFDVLERGFGTTAQTFSSKSNKTNELINLFREF